MEKLKKIYSWCYIFSFIIQLFVLLMPLFTEYMIDNVINGIALVSHVKLIIGILFAILSYGVFSFVRELLTTLLEIKYISTLKKCSA